MNKEAALTVHGKKMIELYAISLLLDAYDDVFSDFDPRPYSERTLSDDFLIEAKKATRDQACGTFELKLLIPKKKRNQKMEIMIKKRLHSYFEKHYHQMLAERKKITRRGIIASILGLVMLFLAGVIQDLPEQVLMIKNISVRGFLTVLLEPAGWFFFWEGLWRALYEVRNIKSDLEFFEKMRHCQYHFIEY